MTTTKRDDDFDDFDASMDTDDLDVYEDADARRDDIDERGRRARLWHWCDVCHGHTGPGSPCYQGNDDEGDES